MTSRHVGVGYKSPTYRAWSSMRQRCTNPKDAVFHRYGGRGITVCERWDSFANFLKDMGEKPAGLQLDRKNNNGNYEPSNCRWATQREQDRNKRTTKMLTYAGKTMCMIDWARHVGLGRTCLQHRLYAGWPLKLALETPSRATKSADAVRCRQLGAELSEANESARRWYTAASPYSTPTALSAALTELSQSRDDALDQAKELAAMRLLAAEPYSIQKVKDELGPISLWTQDGLREEIKRHVDAALKAKPAPIASGDADARRLDWLEDSLLADVRIVGYGSPRAKGENLRAAIDAAIRKGAE